MTRRKAEREEPHSLAPTRMRRCPLCGLKIDNRLMHNHWITKHPMSEKVQKDVHVGLAVNQVGQEREFRVEPEWATCGVCRSRIKRKNLRRHMRKQHNRILEPNPSPPFRRKKVRRDRIRSAEPTRAVEPPIRQERRSSEAKGHHSKPAEPWLHRRKAPSMPLERFSKVRIYTHAWTNPQNLELAKEIIRTRPAITLRGLVDEMRVLVTQGSTAYPYIWWVSQSPIVERILYEDFTQISFIKFENRWQMAYPIKAVGVLAGAQGSDSHERIDTDGYFVL